MNIFKIKKIRDKSKSIIVLFLKQLHHYFPTFDFRLPPSLGFTIVELLVVLTLIGLVSGVGIFSLVNYGNSQTMEQGVNNIKSIFEEAKFNAISSVRLENNTMGDSISCIGDLDKYRIVVNSRPGEAQDTLELFMDCDESELIKTYKLPGSLDLSDQTTCGEVWYKAVRLDASGDPALPCDIAVSGFSVTEQITIDVLGNVKLE